MLRAVTIYAVTAWVVLQVVEVIHEPLNMPAWSMRALVVAAIAGFPISFFLAWIIDFRSNGLIFDFPLWVGEEHDPRPEKKSDVVYVALLALLLAGGVTGVVVLFLESVDETPPEIVTSGAAPRGSIAVLAFESFDGLEDSDYFGAGLAEEILNLLAGIPEMSVAARTSSFRFRGASIDIREVASLLAVRNVLEGSVRRDGNRVRVTAQLINGEAGYHVWSETYDRKLDDIFAIQEEIATAVVNELKIALSVDSIQQLGAQPTEDVDAYIYYLQGRARLQSSIDADVTETAVQLFQDAIELDPGFARAYAGICEARLRLYEITRSTDVFEMAKNDCESANELDPGLAAEIRLALGKLYLHRGSDWYAQAEEQLNDAVAIAPDSSDAYIELGELRVAQNRNDDAEAYFQRAVDVKRSYWRAHEALASFLYRSERYAESAAVYEVVTKLAPDVTSVFGGKGAAYWMLGDMEQARIAYDRSLELKPSRQGYTNMGLRYYYDGQYASAVEMQLQALEFAPDDHRVWGRLAESYRFTDGGDAGARAAYEKAAEFAEANLRVNDSEWVTMGLLGLYYAHLDRRDESTLLVDRAVDMSRRDPEALYYQALARHRLGDIDGALDALESAVAADERYRQFIATDPDLKSLGELERFRQLLPADGSEAPENS